VVFHFGSSGQAIAPLACPLLPILTRTVLRRAFSAKSTENEFAIANDPLTQEARSRPGHVVPLNALNVPIYLLAVLRRAALPLDRFELDPAFSSELLDADPWAHRINLRARTFETQSTSAARSGVAKGVVISSAAVP